MRPLSTVSANVIADTGPIVSTSARPGPFAQAVAIWRRRKHRISQQIVLVNALMVTGAQQQTISAHHGQRAHSGRLLRRTVPGSLIRAVAALVSGSLPLRTHRQIVKGASALAAVQPISTSAKLRAATRPQRPASAPAVSVVALVRYR